MSERWSGRLEWKEDGVEDRGTVNGDLEFWLVVVLSVQK